MKLDDFAPRSRNPVPSLVPFKKFSATRRVRMRSGSGPTDSLTYYLIEAPDRESAERALVEEIAFDHPNSSLFIEEVEWSTHETPDWRTAWRHKKVEVLRPTQLPDGIE